MNSSAAVNTRIPCLDGLRALSIALVLVGHLHGTTGFVAPEALFRWLPSAHMGVRVFFVISGFLITSLLIDEERRTGRISVGKFYFRRAFRIFPAFYVFIAAMFIANRLGEVPLQDWDILHAVTYTMNYNWDRSWTLGHLWSLSVEEQFYLLWPFLLVSAGIARGKWLALGCVMLAPLVRVVEFKMLPEMRIGIGETFETTADAIAAGCALAYFRDWFASRTWFGVLQQPAVMLTLIVGAYLADHYSAYVSMTYTVGETYTNVVIALAIDYCVRHSDGIVGAVLNARPLTFLGKLSYSLYLWQQPFMNEEWDRSWTHFPLNLLLAATFGFASYSLIENPLLRVRSKVERKIWTSERATEGRANA